MGLMGHFWDWRRAFDWYLEWPFASRRAVAGENCSQILMT